ncbi:MAG: adenylate/guanylate cyclase domain-containing protein, partial [Rhodovibrionaceae bacterium]
RRTLAELLQRLSDYGAAVVAFDLIFAEPDRTSPAAMADQLEGEIDSPELTEELRRLPDHDQLFSRALSRTTAVTGYVLTTENNGGQPSEKWGTGFAGDSPLPFLTAYRGAVTSLPELVDAAAGNGHLNALPDIDGVIRRVMLLSRLGDKVYPSLSMEALRTVQGASTYLVKSSNASGVESLGASTGVVSMKVGGLEVPTDPEGGYWIHYTGHRPERFVSASEVLAGNAPAELLSGHIVIIGSSAAGLKDQRPTPLDPAAPGVEIHAEALEQMILGISLLRPDWAIGAEFIFILVLGALLILIQPWLGAFYSAMLGAVAMVTAATGSVYAFLAQSLLFDPVIPSLSVLAVFLSAAFVSFLRTEHDRNQIRSAFGHYLAPELVKRLADNPGTLTLGGETRDISILFADIRGFTTICEGLTPAEITTLINRFLTPMSEAVLTHKGTIDKYVGDQIMAFWNAPLDDPEHARNAFQAALDMRQALVELNGERRQEVEEGETFLPLRMGVGINSGPTLVGNMGSKQRFNYSALGDPVNEASRIEGQTKTYGVDILVSELSLNAANQEGGDAGAARFAALEVDRVRLVGLQRPSRLY